MPTEAELSHEKIVRLAHLRDLKIKIYKTDGPKCIWCGQDTALINKGNNLFATLEHLIPVSWGGTDEVRNLAISCRDCNIKKADKIGVLNEKVARYIVSKKREERVFFA
jgi:5-methylcytosine-specific restriction endonuclease McrA